MIIKLADGTEENIAGTEAVCHSTVRSSIRAVCRSTLPKRLSYRAGQEDGVYRGSIAAATLLVNEMTS